MKSFDPQTEARRVLANGEELSRQTYCLPSARRRRLSAAAEEKRDRIENVSCTRSDELHPRLAPSSIRSPADMRELFAHWLVVQRPMIAIEKGIARGYGQPPRILPPSISSGGAET
jgi:hypothetical protein